MEILEVRPKIVIFRGFSKFFSELLDSNYILILIESSNIFHWKPANVVKKNKETGIINSFFSYFT